MSSSGGSVASSGAPDRAGHNISGQSCGHHFLPRFDWQKRGGATGSRLKCCHLLVTSRRVGKIQKYNGLVNCEELAAFVGKIGSTPGTQRAESDP
jgi:hypothetical protein